MKTTSINQKSFVSIFAALVFLIGGVFTFNDANGQNVSEIDLFSNHYVQQTITQQWSGKHVIYGQENALSGFFIVEDPLSTINYYKLKIDGYVVRDFVVLNDNVFFTGDDHHGDGFYAYFSLNAATSGVVNITYRHLLDNDYQFTGMRCLKAFTQGNETYVVLIGTRVRNGAVQQCLFNVKNSDNTSNYLFDGIEHFDDVEILDDYIVSAARKGGDDELDPVVLRFFERDSLPYWGLLGDTMYHDKDNFYAMGRVRLQKYNGDNCGLLFKNKFSECSIFSFEVYPYVLGITNVINTSHLYNNNNNSNIRIDTLLDIGFNQSNSRLFALCDTIGSTKLNLVSKFTGSASLSSNGAYVIPFIAQSVADLGTAGFYISSIKSGELSASWLRIYHNTHCIEQRDYLLRDGHSEPSPYHQEPNPYSCHTDTETIRYPTTQGLYVKICEDRADGIDLDKE